MLRIKLKVLLVVILSSYSESMDPECLKPVEEQSFCFEVFDLWTFNANTGECFRFRDCTGPYFRLGENVFPSRERCEMKCMN